MVPGGGGGVGPVSGVLGSHRDALPLPFLNTMTGTFPQLRLRAVIIGFAAFFRRNSLLLSGNHYSGVAFVFAFARCVHTLKIPIRSCYMKCRLMIHFTFLLNSKRLHRMDRGRLKEKCARNNFNTVAAF